MPYQKPNLKVVQWHNASFELVVKHSIDHTVAVAVSHMCVQTLSKQSTGKAQVVTGLIVRRFLDDSLGLTQRLVR